MSHTPHTTPPGWYKDQTGQLRWWDGQAWGVAAPPVQASPVPQSPPFHQPAQAQYASAVPAATYVQHAPQTVRTKPRVSKLSIAALILSALVWAFWLLDTYVPRPIAERCQTQECWEGIANGTVNLTPAPTLPQILGWFVAPMLLTAVGLAIAGVIRSSTRPVPSVALVVTLGTVLLMILPSLLMLFGLSLYGVMGASGAFS